MKFRSASNSDREEISELVFEVLREYGLEPDPESTDADLSDIEATYFARGGCFDVLVNDKGRLVGSVGLFRVDAETCELRKMYLQRAEREKGLGEHYLSEL